MTVTANQEQALLELYQLSRQLVSSDDLNSSDILRKIVESAKKALNADVVTLYTFDQKSQKFEKPFTGGSLLNDVISKPEGLFSSSAPPSLFATREEIKSFAGIALRFGGEILGVLYFNYRTPQSFTQEQRELIELFTNQATIAIKTLKFIQQDYYKALSTEQKEQFYSCFVSYSSKDEEFAQILYKDLQERDVRCWFAPVDMKIGDRIRSRIDKMIHQYDKLLLILSDSSIGSQWVEHEVEAALEKERKKKNTVLFPIRLDGTVMSIKSGWANYIRNTRNIGDFSNWKETESYNKSFESLLTALRKGKK
jgi:hypothetical protein